MTTTMPRTAGALTSPRPKAARDYLMCPPTYFSVRYRINPWMHPERPVDTRRAAAQWQRLHDTVVGLGHRVHLAEPDAELPDMVFAANGGIVIGDRALVPRFRHAERQGESERYAEAFARLGIRQVEQSRYVNEGEGDFLLAGTRILAGTGPRSDPRAPAEVAEYFDARTLPLALVDPRLYHLDTALAVLDDQTIAYWPGAFDAASQARLQDHYPDAILATEADATGLELNMVSDGDTVIVNSDRTELAHALRERGFRVVPNPTGEFLKGGGGAKCCVLQLHGYASR